MSRLFLLFLSLLHWHNNHTFTLPTQPEQAAKTAPPSPTISHKTILLSILLLYLTLFIILSLSRRAQSYLIYLHWLRPPTLLFPLQNLRPHRLAATSRPISHKNLHGWHLLPPGPPFPSETSFSTQLAAPTQRVILFFHGNSGTRACPTKRVDHIRLLAAHLSAHVITFDYSGFADCSGAPSETQLATDARVMYDWIAARVASDTDIILYGQSLGSFPAIDLAAMQCDYAAQTGVADGASAVILDAPPASLVDAAMTHPLAKPFRVVPYCDKFFRLVLKERLDSVGKMHRLTVPTLILHGELDRMISVQQGQKLYDAAKKAGVEEIEFVRFPGCGHNNVCGSPDYLRVVNRFLDKHLVARVGHRM